MLDRYHLEHELGAGARGIVYCGRDGEDGQRVAVKLSAVADDRSIARDCSIRALAHPHIASLYRRGNTGKLRYVVMELAAGGDLKTYVEPSHLLPLATVVSIMSRVAGALHYAHQQGVVHGDVKPANIVYDPLTDSVKVVDFGSGFGEPSHELASLAYSAPERLCGFSPSPASDQFSFAVTLYQLVCGALPFGGKTRPEKLWRIMHAPPDDVGIYTSSLPESYPFVLNKALAKDPRSRYANMRVLRNAMLSAGRDVEGDRSQGHRVCR